MKGESATLEPLPNFPDGGKVSIVRRWMSRAVEEKCHGSTGSPSALSEEDSKGGVTVLEGTAEWSGTLCTFDEGVRRARTTRPWLTGGAELGRGVSKLIIRLDYNIL